MEAFGKWLDEHSAREWAIGDEVGLDGYAHYQIVVHFKKGINWDVLKMAIGPMGHVEPSHVQNFDYATKCGKYICSWEGAISKFRSLDLLPWEEEILSLLANQNDRQILVVQSLGGQGKSTFAKYLEANHILDLCPVVSDEYNDYTGYCFAFQKEGYCFDIPRSESIKKRNAMWAGLEQIKNGLLFEKRYKPQKTWIQSPKLLVFTNERIPYDALTRDRWTIKHIDGIVLKDGEHPEIIAESERERGSSAGKPCNTEPRILYDDSLNPGM